MRLFPIDAREVTAAPDIVERLSAHRRVEGHGPWTVVFHDTDTAEAMSTLDRELTAIDPGWFRILDFRAIPSMPAGEDDFA